MFVKKLSILDFFGFDLLTFDLKYVIIISMNFTRMADLFSTQVELASDSVDLHTLLRDEIRRIFLRSLKETILKNKNLMIIVLLAVACYISLQFLFNIPSMVIATPVEVDGSTVEVVFGVEPSIAITTEQVGAPTLNAVAEVKIDEVVEQEVPAVNNAVEVVTTVAENPIIEEIIVETPPLNIQAVETAKKYLGVPYVWGGTSPRGFDCSGLVQYVYAQLGISISRTASSQAREGVYVDRANLTYGDLVFFARGGYVHHVGMYIGDGKMIHAPHSGDVVRIVDLSSHKNYYTARRIIR